MCNEYVDESFINMMKLYLIRINKKLNISIKWEGIAELFYIVSQGYSLYIGYETAAAATTTTV